ncbi:D-alanyl-D-alanine carboxypeptidase family protein [Mycobacterium marinum]|uniref:D-alanyl-D-alanine carboxypeptidase DacB n=1 Tax=Mycobacterium marinum (strain ATCC BAA-535 / M) TaxID=216594 RepID=B2HJL0_MYCMM|nr:D-alanyl-D-alanine carboxypeptidase family protein [Mycobacterium marinum]ACC40246.1 D-alanyl-D-alanine carboxypeptidase DacB [Mycobacterium marinum M]EPQ75555.1 D-alanyl-D-alanine carboxypeptidase [Mycobacterium marinum MB2]MDC8975343.1 D-alanyl-D-alanine carboxypeptidase [Mycobacterium marinum]MDC9003372.1 D-alanyl-D-alanine carboxypeptidase [Mycobacterium marinum]QQW35003.1 D-alanyl-D-alanine carboxypeptidase [Mycobacterium marinum]
MRKVMAVAAALLTAATISGATASADTEMQPAGSVPIPDGPAQTWIVADLDTGQVLAGRDQNVTHPPASTIKVLLALVALDELDLNSTVVADEADTHVECNCVGVKAGHTYTARQLLDGLLLVSGNDAANTLAQMLGGQDAAVAKMNAKAAALGAMNTHAATPSGLDGPGGSGWSTAHDLAVIFRTAMANPVFAHITAEPSAMFPGEDGEHPIVNQDELLQRYPGAIGGKTGYTNAARKTFVGAAARNGRRLVIAMMYGLVKEGGPTYWDQAGSLFDWGFALNPQSGIGSL